MLNNLKLLKNLFALFFAFLILSILIRYNESLLINTFNYLNLGEPFIQKIQENNLIPIYASIFMTINGFVLFLVGFRINKLEKETIL